MAASEKQIAANRRNALRSTGPKTTQGKERSRANATTHGLTASATIYRPVRHENPADFHEIRAKLFADWRPVGTREELAVEMIAAAYKRVQRAEAMEVAFWDGGMEAIQMTHGKPRQATDSDDLGCGLVMGQKANRLTWDNLDRYRRAAWLDYNRAVEQLRKLQRDREDAPARAQRAHKAMCEYLERTRVPGINPSSSTELASFCPGCQQALEAAPTPHPVTPRTSGHAPDCAHDAPPKAA